MSCIAVEVFARRQDDHINNRMMKRCLLLKMIGLLLERRGPGVGEDIQTSILLLDKRDFLLESIYSGRNKGRIGQSFSFSLSIDIQVVAGGLGKCTINTGEPQYIKILFI